MWKLPKKKKVTDVHGECSQHVNHSYIIDVKLQWIVLQFIPASVYLSKPAHKYGCIFASACVCVSNIKHESNGWCTCGFHIFSFFFSFFPSSSSGTVLSPLTCLLKGIRWWDFLRGRDERRMSRAPDNYCNHFVLGWYAVKSAERNYKRFRFNFAPLLSTAKNVVPTYVQNRFTPGSGSGS